MPPAFFFVSFASSGFMLFVFCFFLNEEMEEAEIGERGHGRMFDLD